MKATEQYFPVVLFIMLHKVILTFESVDETLRCHHSNENPTEQYFPVMLFIMLCKMVLTFESVNKILWYADYSKYESSLGVISCGNLCLTLSYKTKLGIF